MDIKVEITQKIIYSIKINGVEFHDFKKIDEWQGMALFKNPKGSIIVHEDEVLLPFLHPFTNKGKENNIEVKVVRISPNLLPTQNQK